MKTSQHARLALSLLMAFSMTGVNAFAQKGKVLTRENGAPVGDNQNSQTAGEWGPVLLQDAHLIEKLARFDRERVPERVVHARGTGAYGTFKSYADHSDLTMAAPFNKSGKTTKVFVRFSTVINFRGSPETLRDPRGFATKFYSDQGNWDLVGNNLPVFFIRDAMKFPDMVHSLKPSPVSNQQDPNRYLDFFAHVPESTHMWTYLYSNLGTPANYRQMDGNGVHAFKFINRKGQVRYVKFNWKSQQGIKNLTSAEASAIQANDFQHATRDLYDSINAKKFPSWELQAQILNPEDLNKFDFNPLDPTKEWIRIPNLRIVKLGLMTLNKVPDNFHEHTEQSAFAPSNLVPGIEGSEDRLLQGRLFSYADTQRYRVGVNVFELPVNKPINTVSSHGQDGQLDGSQSTLDINYQPNSFSGGTSRSGGIFAEDPAYKMSSLKLDGSTQQAMIKKTLNFRQAGETYRSYSEEDKKHLIANFAADLNQVKNIKIKEQWVAHTYAADPDYGKRLAEATKTDLNKARKIAEQLNDDPARKAASVEQESSNEAFFDAAKSGDVGALKGFLEGKPAALNAQDEKGYTALIFSAYHGHKDAVDFLISKGADACVKDERGNTALLGAIFKGEVGIAKKLMKTKCGVDQANEAGQTPLMFAALFGRNEIARDLIGQGADVKKRDMAGTTAVGLAESQGNEAFLEMVR